MEQLHHIIIFGVLGRRSHIFLQKSYMITSVPVSPTPIKITLELFIPVAQ